MIPVHERKILEAHIRGVPLNSLALQERPLNEYEAEQLKNLIKLRMRGLPLQYLTGVQAFYGRNFYVNTGVLIPRPETEGLVELALQQLSAQDARAVDRTLSQRPSVLDFGTGSGCIALTIALERPDVFVYASECSADSAAVADENAAKLRVGNVDFIRVSETPQLWQYDDVPLLSLLIANPPYLISTDEVAQDVRENEPSEALYAPDDDALFYYRFLVELMQHRVKPDGAGLFEIASDRAAETAQLFSAQGYKTNILKDLPGRDRYLLVEAGVE